MFVIGLPRWCPGPWLALELLGRLNEPGFRKVVLVLPLLSGATVLLYRMRRKRNDYRLFISADRCKATRFH